MQQKVNMDINSTPEQRSYMTVGLDEINLIDFSQVLQNSEETVRKNNDLTRFLISREGQEPSFIPSLQTKSQVYTYDEILVVMDTDEWKYQPITGTTEN